MNGGRLPTGKPKLRKREIALAVGAGLVAAAGAAAVIDGMQEDGNRREQVVVVADSSATDQTYTVGRFEKIAIVGPEDAVISYGDEFAVRAEGSSDALSRMEVAVEDGTLAIRPKSGFGRIGWRGVEPATFYITMPKLTDITLAGSGDVTVDKVVGPRFSSVVAGSGQLEVAALDVDRANFTIGGSGTLSTHGKARSTSVKIGGSGQVEADDFTSEDADIVVAGSGDVDMGVTGNAKVSILGSGDVAITGTDSCTVNRLGSGDVSCNGEAIGED